MCDSFAVLSDISASGAAILAKNSDRPSFDCQPAAFHERKRFPKDEKLRLAYITIDQVPERFATLGSSPYWCWGYETGLNEFGVAIGNEAVYTRDLDESAESEKSGKKVEKGLLGMEILRLGLERGTTAREALSVMTELIERYGQWGSGVPMQDTVSGSYNNAFLIVDSREAYVLETAGKRWAAKKVDRGYAAISNELSIRRDITVGSRDLAEYAVSRNWWPENEVESFDFASAYIERKKPRQVSHIRVQRMRQLLEQAVKQQGKVSTGWIKRILRDHYEDTFLEGPFFNAADPDFLTICMHQSAGGFTWGNTASSSICILPEDKGHPPAMWWAAGVPCCSVYIPLFPEAGRIPECLTKAGTFGKNLCAPSEVKQEDLYKEGSFWWEMRSLLDLVNGDEKGAGYEERHKIVRALFDELEEKWKHETETVIKEAIRIGNNGETEKRAEILYCFTEKCTKEALSAVKKAKRLFS
mgnify:CR=1 FL=1